MSENHGDAPSVPQNEPAKQGKVLPTKVLPTDRLSFDKQMAGIRGYAAASGPERRAVGNRDVGVIVQIHENTISICNPFFQDIGLLLKEGQKNRPSDEVADYAQAYEWDTEKAAQKLAPVFRRAWFSTALIPKLTFRSLSKEEAITFLANEAKAPKEFKARLELLLDYLKATGIVQYDGVTVSLGPQARDNGENVASPARQNVEITLPAGSLNMQSSAPVTSNLHPFIKGLIDKLPEPDTNWPLEDRVKWLSTAANIFDLMYKNDDLIGLVVEAKGSSVTVKKNGTP